MKKKEDQTPITKEGIVKKPYKRLPPTDPPRPRGRQPKPIDLNRVRECARQGMLDKEIGAVLGIHPSTFCVKQHLKEFSEAIAQGQAEGVMMVGGEVFRQAMAGHFPSQKLFLEAKHKWNKDLNLNVSGEINGSVKLVGQFEIRPEIRELLEAFGVDVNRGRGVSSPGDFEE